MCRLISLAKATEEVPHLGFNPGRMALKSTLLPLCHIERDKRENTSAIHKSNSGSD